MPRPPQLPGSRAGVPAPPASGLAAADVSGAAAAGGASFIVRVLGRMSRRAAIATGLLIGGAAGIGVTAAVAIGGRSAAEPATAGADERPRPATAGESAAVPADAAADRASGVALGAADPGGPGGGGGAAEAAPVATDAEADAEEPAVAGVLAGTSGVASPPAGGNGSSPAAPGDTAGESGPTAEAAVIATSQCAELADLRKRALRLPLPRLARGLRAIGQDPVELAKIPVAAPADCELELVAEEVVFGSDAPVRFKEVPDVEGARRWDVEQVAANTFSGAPVFGTFRWANQSLTFQWASGVTASSPAECLRYCLLEVRAGGESELCWLSEPKRVPAAALDLTAAEDRLEIEVHVPSAALAERLRVDLAPEGFAAHELDGGGGLSAGEMVTASFVPAPGAGLSAGSEYVDLEMRLLSEKGRLLLATQPFLTRNEINERNYSVREQRRVFPLNDVLRASGEQETTRRALERRLKETQDNGAPIDAALAVVAQKQQLGVLKGDGPRIKLLKAQRDRLRSQESAIRSAIEAVKRNDEIIKAAKPLYQDLQANGRIGYTVFVEVEGRRVELLKASGTASAPASAGTPGGLPLAH
jgi:hypothetical protein